jgi:hypothetical protein
MRTVELYSTGSVLLVALGHQVSGTLGLAIVLPSRAVLAYTADHAATIVALDREL